MAVDVVETLVSLDAVVVALEDHGAGPDAGERLFSRLLRDGFALAASGAYRPFHEVADSALAAVAPTLAASHREAVLATFSRLDAHPDARPALEHLRGAGLAVAALTNGAAATTTALLERTGLDALVAPGDQHRRGAGLETGPGTVPARGRGPGRRTAAPGPGGGSQLGYPWRPPRRPGHRMGVPP
ncbi:MAG TPA: HAD family hydrolase [Acidimicrobiales bacterium]|nr:HAD family hydrolase [Acidimicrobiales bacterium]